jgi:hypothetical protein
MNEKQPIREEIQINLTEMTELMNVAIRRASSFARLGLDDLEKRGNGDFNLSTKISYQFWPAAISDTDRDAAREEFRAWIAGSCLRELDLFYSIFLDKTWRAIELTELHQKVVHAGFRFDNKFEKKTNVARKQQMVCDKLNIESHFDALNSLSLGRNALAHRAGFIKAPNHCNNSARDALELKWFAFDFVLERDGVQKNLEIYVIDKTELPDGGETTVYLKNFDRRLIVKAGEKLILSLEHLAELCMFYFILHSKVKDGLVEFMKGKGITPLTLRTCDT